MAYIWYRISLIWQTLLESCRNQYTCCGFRDRCICLCPTPTAYFYTTKISSKVGCYALHPVSNFIKSTPQICLVWLTPQSCLVWLFCSMPSKMPTSLSSWQWLIMFQWTSLEEFEGNGLFWMIFWEKVTFFNKFFVLLVLYLAIRLLNLIKSQAGWISSWITFHNHDLFKGKWQYLDRDSKIFSPTRIWTVIS